MPKDETDTTNMFRALMGHSFQCRLCGHRHQPTSRAAMRCCRTLPRQAVPEADIFSLETACTKYAQLPSTLRSRGQLKRDYVKIWNTLKGELRMAHFPPDATISELAVWNGKVRYRARYALWEREHQAELTRLRKAKELFVAQVEHLVADQSGHP